jgi:TolA protein
MQPRGVFANALAQIRADKKLLVMTVFLALAFFGMGGKLIWDRIKNTPPNTGQVTNDENPGGSNGEENNEENPGTVGEVTVNPPGGTPTGTPPVSTDPKVQIAKLEVELDTLNNRITRFTSDITAFEKKKQTTADPQEKKKIDKDIKEKQTNINNWKKQKATKEAELKKLKDSVGKPKNDEQLNAQKKLEEEKKKAEEAEAKKKLEEEKKKAEEEKKKEEEEKKKAEEEKKKAEGGNNN